MFKNENADRKDIISSGEKFLTAFYSNFDDNIALDTLRYQCFVKSITKSKLNLMSLPPTSDAAQYHLLQIYYQVQLWYDRSKNAEEWGWKRSKIGLTLITTTKDLIPQVLLKFISYKCKKGCGQACGCRKIGLKCSIIYAFCNGVSCQNVLEVLSDFDDEDDDNDDEETLEINQFFTNKMGDDKDMIKEEEEENSQAEPIDPDQPGPSRRSKKLKR